MRQHNGCRALLLDHGGAFEMAYQLRAAVRGRIDEFASEIDLPPRQLILRLILHHHCSKVRRRHTAEGGQPELHDLDTSVALMAEPACMRFGKGTLKLRDR